MQVTNKRVLENRSGSGDITEEAFIYMVLEYGEIDLAGMLSAKRKEMQSNNETKPDENWLRFYWQVLISHIFLFRDRPHFLGNLKSHSFMKYVQVLHNCELNLDLRYYFESAFQEFIIGKRNDNAAGSNLIFPRVIGCCLDISDLFEHICTNHCFAWPTANTGGCEDHPR